MTTIKQRRGTAAQWTSANPVLAAGEPGFETDTGNHKIGDGATAWNSLKATNSATYVPGIVGAPSGGDDAAALKAALTGIKDVYLAPGATYVVSSLSAWPAFSGKIHGQGATINFTYAGVFQSTGLITAWTDVVVEGVTIKGNPSFHALLAAGCARITFRDCTFLDMGNGIAEPIDSDLTVEDCRFTESGGAGYGLQQFVCPPSSGHFRFLRNDVNFTPSGSAGSIIGGSATTLTGPSTAWVIGNRVFDKDLAGYTIDGAFDFEPAGAIQYDAIVIEDNTIYNTTCYVSGAKRITARGNTHAYTAHNGASFGWTPYTIFNSHGTQPATGTVVIEDNDLTCISSAVTAASGFFSQSIATTKVVSRNNRMTLNGASTGGTNPYTFGPNIGELIIDGDDIAATGNIAVASAILNGTNTANQPSKLHMRRCRLSLQTSHLVSTNSGTITTLLIGDNDFTGLQLLGSALAMGSTAVTNLRLRGNAGWNPFGNTFPGPAAPAVPASTVAATNTTGADATVVITGGTVSAVAIGGVATGLAATPAVVRVPAGQTITLTYTVAPSWAWFGD